MSAPSTDSAAIKHIIRALIEAGYTLNCVDDGGDERIPVKNETEAVAAITAVDEASLLVNHPVNRSSHVFFVLGNEPLEVACDYGMSLDPIISPLVDKWMDES